MQDSLLQLQSSVTKTADFNSTAVDLGTIGGGYAKFFARIIYSATRYTTAGTGTNYVVFYIQHSDDNSTFYNLTPIDTSIAEALTLTASNVAGEIYLPVVTKKRYVRLVFDYTAASGGAATSTYEAYLTQTAP